LQERIYELMYLADPEVGSEDIEKLNASLKTIVEQQGGTVVRVDDIGLRKLAYEIKRKTKGYYVLFEIQGSGKEIAELERKMRVNDQIIRYLTVRVDEDRKTAEKMRAKRIARQEKRANSKRSEGGPREEIIPFEGALSENL